MSREKQTYNPCDDCQYSYSKNGQESGMCKICEFEYFKDRKQSEVVKEVLEKAASKFAGHSDYHGDTILQVCYCMAEGKEVDNAKPLDAKQSGTFSRGHENDSGWISVEERLPKPTYCVLVYGDEGEMEIDALGYDGEWMGYVDVTHWMPLPEAPKEGGGE